MKLIISILLTLSFLFSQEYEDVIYLKNGSIIYGTIIEHVPGDYYKIKSERNIFVFKIDEIEKFSKEEKKSEGKSDGPHGYHTEKWYFLYTVGYNNGYKWELYSDIDIKGGISMDMGFYGHVSPKLILGWTFSQEQYKHDSMLSDFYVFDLLNAISLIGYANKFGQGLFYRFDIGSSTYLENSYNAITSPEERVDGTGFLCGVGYSIDFKHDKRLLISLNHKQTKYSFDGLELNPMITSIRFTGLF